MADSGWKELVDFKREVTKSDTDQREAPINRPEFHLGRADRFKGSNWALATITLVVFLTFLDNTIVSVVLANVQSALHAG